MTGVLDYINKINISGWFIGTIKSFEIYIDGVKRENLNINLVERKDAEKNHPGKVVTGFLIDTPDDLLDTKTHRIELKVSKVDLENSPALYSYQDRKILFLHLAKAGGSTINVSLQNHFSAIGQEHIQEYLMPPLMKVAGLDRNDFDSKQLYKFNKKEYKNYIINPKSDWLSGHVNAFNANYLINKFYRPSLYKKLKSTFVKKKKFSTFDFYKKIDDFHVVSIVRNPIEQIISGINWFHAIVNNENQNFLFDHPLNEIQRILFYVKKSEKNSISMLSTILSLGLLNTQSRFLAPTLMLSPDPKKAKLEISKYHYIGRLENINQMIKIVTYPENNFPISIVNQTKNPFYSLDDLNRPVKDFILTNLKPDLILYDAVQEHFG